MLVGYMRVSKADGSQVTDLQRDALLAAGVDAGRIYEDAASGKRDDRPGLAACLKALREGDTLVVWQQFPAGGFPFEKTLFLISHFANPSCIMLT
jgi:DNA invertase Pin-like site-specific DNA recombinase